MPASELSTVTATNLHGEFATVMTTAELTRDLDNVSDVIASKGA